MACMKLGSKSEVFHLDGHTWLCSTGLQSDVIIEIGETSFHLHKFPLLSRSEALAYLIGDHSSENEKKCVLQLHDVPGGAKTFLLIAKFCYGVKMELTTSNVVSLRCAAEYFGMSEDYGEENLIAQTENFLNEVFGGWTDSLKALETCEKVRAQAEELHIVSRCINSLAMKASADPSLFSWPMQGGSEMRDPCGTVFWNGIRTSATPHPVGEDWWYEDVSLLRLPLYKRLILAVRSNDMKPKRVAGALMYYAKRHLPLLGRESSIESGNFAAPRSTISGTSEADQRNLLEELVGLLPDQRGATPSNFLLRLLRTATMIHASPSCRGNLEKRVGAQLDQASLQDLLIPNTGYSVETLYDIDCVQRILDHFMLVDHDNPTSNYIVDEEQMMEGSHFLTPKTTVANLIDSYLAEVAPDVNLKLAKFHSLAAAVPEYARSLDDGIYRAIDIYLKAHPWLTDSEREQLCRLMNCKKFSLEASTHATQNERLPLRVIVQVVFFEQLRLRTSVSGLFYVSENLDNSQHPSGNLALARNDLHAEAGATHGRIAVDDMKKRVSELEIECLSMKQKIEKMGKTKLGSWNNLFRKFAFSQSKSKPGDPKASKPTDTKESSTSSAPLVNGGEHHNNESVE
ncbi:PREDICTED: BTB/POZ domain-containing protein At5g03250-like [Populus euphratica]|uniref:BTB/POZ domain-containing protein At5g03250-like n=1 Tax=Populus euphratica TaxID=75702 RepID=A0AAJ6V392_POPEU|nr:PREDICTED: BTB/POZ domain-containing protein At5g03250-like [Populus euphratica]